MHAPVIIAFKAGSGVTAVAVTAGERIAAKNTIRGTCYTLRFIEMWQTTYVNKLTKS